MILLLGQAFAFAISIGLLASSTTGGAANLTGSSCCHFFWETLKNLSLLRGGHLRFCRADKTTSQWGVILCAVLVGSTQSRREQQPQELCESLQSLLLQACYVKSQSLLAGCDKSVSPHFSNILA